MARQTRWLLALSPLVVGACFEDSLQPPGTGSDATTGDSADAGSSAPDTSDASADASSDDGSTSASDDTTLTSAADATDDDGTTSDDGGPGCPLGSTCTEPAPPGWNGPFVVPMAPGENPASCPMAFPDLVSSVHADLSAPPLGCACTCAPSPTVCEASVGLYLDGACATFDLAQQAGAGGCVQTTGVTAVMATATADPTPAACDPTVQVTDTPVGWETTASLCAPTTPPPTCDEGMCVPQSTDSASICVLREGEHACPPGPYQAASTFHSGAQDGRTCSACTCGTPEGTQCAGILSALEQHASGDCSGAIVDTLAIDDCGPASTSARYVPQDLGACATVTDTMPIGEVTPAGPVTLCCIE